MNLFLIRSKNKTEDFILSITKNCETLIKQSHRKPQELHEIKQSKSRETFHFNPSNNLGLDSNWMSSFITPETYNSTFNIKEQNNKFELHTDTFDDFSFSELIDELEAIFSVSDITPQNLQHEMIGPHIIET